MDEVTQAGCGCAFLIVEGDHEQLVWCGQEHKMEAEMTDTTPQYPYRNRGDMQELRDEIAHHPKFTSEDDDEAYLMRRVVSYCDLVLKDAGGPSFTLAYGTVLTWMDHAENRSGYKLDDAIYDIHLAVRQLRNRVVAES